MNAIQDENYSFNFLNNRVSTLNAMCASSPTTNVPAIVGKYFQSIYHAIPQPSSTVPIVSIAAMLSPGMVAS